MQRILCGLLCGLVLSGGIGPTSEAVRAAEAPDPKLPIIAETKLDFRPLAGIAVLHNGRVQPLDTFAREQVELICGTSHPKLEIGGKVRKYAPLELFYSWMVEPKKWEEIDFIKCKYHELRKDILGLDVVDKNGEALNFVSPVTIQDSQKFFVESQRSRFREQAAKERGEEYESTGLDRALLELDHAYFNYNLILVDPASDVTAQGGIRQTLAPVNEALSKLTMALKSEPLLAEALAEHYGAVYQTYEKLQSLGQGHSIDTDAFFAAAAEFGTAAQASSEAFKSMLKRAQDTAPAGEHFPADKLKSVQTFLAQRTSELKQIAVLAEKIPDGLYSNNKLLRVVPALNVEAFEAYRQEGKRTATWLDLQTILTGAKGYFEQKGYPVALIDDVRAKFALSKQAYNQRDPEKFAASEVAFAQSLRTLGEKLTPMIKKLDFKDRDDRLLAAVSYPTATQFDTELTYNKVQPFFYTWIVSLMAMIAFALAFGSLKKPMIVVGLVFLVGSLALSVYGFALRVMITQFAPVTNMYETVIYVAFVSAALALWFFLLPITWDGLRLGWRMTAIPGTPEATPISAADTKILSESSIQTLSYVLSLARIGLVGLIVYALAIAPYTAGGHPAINLSPQVDIGEKWPNVNNFTVWLVGLGVLLTSLYYLPRALLALAGAIVTVPLSMVKSDKPLFARMTSFPRPLIALAGTFAAFTGGLIAWYAPILEEGFKPLQPVLRDNFWLTIHVLTIVSSYAAGALAWGIGNLALGFYLLGRYRTVSEAAADSIAEEADETQLAATSERKSSVRRTAGGKARETHAAVAVVEPTEAARRPADGLDHSGEHPAKRPPQACLDLAQYVYRVTQVAVVLLAAGTILGGLWADVSWGRFWGWDPKEVWALISLLVYLAILHGRYAGWFGNFGLAAGSVLGFSAIVMSWYGVNFVLGAGLHSYGFGSNEGQIYVFSAVALNWVFVGLALFRYLAETQEGRGPSLREVTQADG